MGRTRAVGIAIVVLLAGCDSADPRGPRAAPSPSASPRLYVCANSMFDPAVFEAGGLERDDPELRDLVESLNRTRRATVGGWHVVAERPDQVHALARIPGGYVSRLYRRSFVAATFERSGDGWTPDSLEECRPEVVVDGRTPMLWELAVEPSPRDTQLVVAVDRTCGNGALTRRHTDVEVEYSAESVTLIVTLDPFRPDCTDATWRLTVPLDEPLGERALFDAATYPVERRYPCTRRGSRLPGPLVCSQRVPAS
ncbi:MAG TPA: hypothetical protein VHJ76_03855 [Actinomycetota bacterium]|nr:hypothetical protein [Actinomycetota bacterium]